MYRMENLLKILTTMLVTMLLCIACGEKDVVDVVEKMYDNGIERVQKAESIEDIQQIYDEVTKQVNDFKTEHLKEFAALDSIASSLQKTKETFVKACCIKLETMNSALKTEDGLIRIDENGSLYDPEELAGDDGDGTTYNQNNPLNIIGYTFISNPDSYLGNYIIVQTSNGDCLYNEEDAERYYDYYVSHFFFAARIASSTLNCRSYGYLHTEESTREYIKKNLFNIVSNLPLDNSYPSDVVEKVNEIYYNYKEEAATLHLIKRDYGRSLYGYYADNNPNKLYHFDLCRCRDTDNGGKLKFD